MNHKSEGGGKNPTRQYLDTAYLNSPRLIAAYQNIHILDFCHVLGGAGSCASIAQERCCTGRLPAVSVVGELE